MYVRHVKLSSTTDLIHLTHVKVSENVNSRYDMTKFVLKTEFCDGSKSVSIDNTLLETLSIRLLFTMLRNTGFTGQPVSNPYFFKLFGLSHLYCT